MKILLVVLVLSILSVAAISAAQVAPVIQWEKTFGGHNRDESYCMIEARQGGYVVVGECYSTDGDVTNNHGGADIWVIRLDRTGKLLWQKAIGGPQNDFGYRIIQSSDGGFVIGGIEANAAVLTKLDSNGTTLWRSSIVTGAFYLWGLLENPDGGFSAAGSLTFYAPKFIDAWVVRTDGLGKVMWQRTLGGSGDDWAAGLAALTDGNLEIAITADSKDFVPNPGLESACLIKLDLQGNILSQKCYGGSRSETVRSIAATDQGGVLITGTSTSIDGDLLNVRAADGMQHFWVAQISKSGSIDWQRCLGGSAMDVGRSVAKTNDGGCIVAAEALSNDGALSKRQHPYSSDFWVLKFDSVGGVQWETFLGGSRDDVPESIIQTSDGWYAVTGTTSSFDGDVTELHADSALGFLEDYWVVKLGPNRELTRTYSSPEARMCDSVDAEVAVHNHSMYPVKILGYGIHPPFKIVRDTLPSTLQPGDSTTVTLRFQPTHLGWVSDSLEVHAMMNAEPFDTVLTIIGDGIRGKPAMQLMQSLRSTDSLRRCDLTRDTIIVRSVGCDTLFLSEFLPDSSTAIFLRRTRVALPVGDADTIILGITPLKNGPFQSALHIRDQQEDSILPIRAIGIDGYPKLSILSQPPVPEYVSLCASLSDTILIQSSGCNSLGLQVGLSDSTSGFQFTHNHGSSFAPGAIDTIVLAFSPLHTGVIRDSIRVDWQLGKIVIPLEEHVVNGSVLYTLNRGKENFDRVPLCTYANDTLIVRNIGCDTLQLRASLDDSTHGISLVRTTAPLIFSGRTDTLILHFAPQSIGLAQTLLHLHSQVGDSILSLTGTGVRGSASYAISTPKLDFGSMTICEQKLDTIVITGTGCDSLTATYRLTDSTVGYGIANSYRHSLGPRETDTIFVTLKPVGIGAFNDSIVVRTHNGESTIPLRVIVVSGQAKVKLQSTVDTVDECDSGKARLRVVNTGCDTISITLRSFGGADSAEFHFGSSGYLVLAPDSAVQLSGEFIPLGLFNRTSLARLNIRSTDGTSKDTLLQIVGVSKPTPPTHVSIESIPSVMAGAQVDIPVKLIDAAKRTVSQVDVLIELNTQLLSSASIDVSSGTIPNATVSNFQVHGDSIAFSLLLPHPTLLTPGELCRLRCETRLTDTLATSIKLRHVILSDAAASTQCLGVTIEPDSTASFTLQTECGDKIISKFMAVPATISLDGVTPNPAKRSFSIHLRSVSTSPQSAVIEIYDDLGKCVLKRFVEIPFGTSSVTIMNDGLEGLHFIRVSTTAQSCTSQVIFEK